MDPDLRLPESPESSPRMSIMGEADKVAPRLLPALLLAIVATALWPDWFGFLGPFAGVGRMAGLAIGAIGLVFWASAGIGLVRAYRVDRLCTTGAFGLCRHPIFAWWVFFVLPPLGLIFDSWPFLVTAMYVGVAVRPAMEAEEAYLVKRYGEAYERYAREVHRIVPFPRLRPSVPARHGPG